MAGETEQAPVGAHPDAAEVAEVLVRLAHERLAAEAGGPRRLVVTDEQIDAETIRRADEDQRARRSALIQLTLFAAAAALMLLLAVLAWF